MIFETISKCPVLSGLKSEELQSLFGEIHHNIRAYTKENIIIQAGERCEHLMILIEGVVKGEMIDYAGNKITIEEIAAPKPIAPGFLFGKQNICPVTVISITKVRIVHIPRQEVLRLFQKNSSILVNYLDIVSNRAQFLSRKVKLLSLKTLKQKVAHYLLEQKEQGPLFQIQTQREIADILGVTRPALARTLNQLENEQIIDYQRKSIRILNPIALNKILMHR